ncbi:hypothetical protein [Kitasatospora sp. NPDC058046]|uniref:hypothetical protein n=1 Tax=Kitasatospora sp. NPDC058046 TaxID=3346312 RepID=UPI0036D8449C
MVDGAVAAGIPADYALVLRRLTGVGIAAIAVIAGNGARPTGDTGKGTGRPRPSASSPSATPGTWTLEEK